MKSGKFIVTLLILLSVFVSLFIGCTSQPSATNTTSKIPVTTTPKPTTTLASTTPATTLPPQNTNTANAQYGGVLKYCFTAPTSFGYPAEISVGAQIWAATPAIEYLCGTKMGQFQPTKLATAASFSSDLKTLTITLRQGVKFHDDTDFNAEAVKWNLTNAWNAKKEGTETFSSIDAVDNYTVRINLKTYQNTILDSLASITGMMISPTAFQKNGIAWARQNPVGTGPFKFVSYQPNVSLKYTRFDGYWQKGKPYLQALEFYYIVDPMTQAAAIKVGDINMIGESDLVIANDLQKVGFNIVASGFTSDMLIADSANPSSPLADVRTRQACEYAINKEAITKTVSYGFWQPIYQIAIPLYTVSYVSDLPQRKFDPAKAKQLLKEAGYPNGFDMTIYLRVGESQITYSSIQQYLADVGIKAKLDFPDTTVWLQELQTTGWKNGLIFTGFGGNPNVYSVINTRYGRNGTSAKSMIRPTDYCDLLDKSIIATDYPTTQSLAQQVSKIMFDQAMVLPLWIGGKPIVMDPHINGTNFMVTGRSPSWTPEDIWFSK